MSDLSSRPAYSGILDSLVLAASFDTAVRFLSYHRARRSGVDPSAQESAVVATARLATLLSDLNEVAGRVRLHRLLDVADVRTEAYVIRRFEELMLVSKGADMLRIAHQTLLSLYPAIDGSVVEAARELLGQWLAAAQDGFSDLEAVDRLDAFIGVLRADLGLPDGF